MASCADVPLCSCSHTHTGYTHTRRLIDRDSGHVDLYTELNTSQVTCNCDGLLVASETNPLASEQGFVDWSGENRWSPYPEWRLCVLSQENFRNSTFEFLHFSAFFGRCPCYSSYSITICTVVAVETIGVEQAKIPSITIEYCITGYSHKSFAHHVYHQFYFSSAESLLRKQRTRTS